MAVNWMSGSTPKSAARGGTNDRNPQLRRQAAALALHGGDANED